MPSRVWHITGANTGLGLALALKALSEGDRVIAAVRSPSKVPPTLQVPNVKVLQFDLSLPQPELNAYAAHAFADFGQVDVLVNNAGYGYMGAIEETEDALVKKQFDINVLGILRTIRAVLPVLREAKSGKVMNLSSVGGLHGYPSNGVYCATKFAIEGITEALAAEIAPFGIRAVIVEPGYFRTSFLTGPGDPVEGAARMWEYVAGEGLFAGKERLLRLPLRADAGSQMRKTAADLEKTASYYDDVWRSTDFKE